MICKDKVVLISGGTGGIGSTLCRAFAREGANIYFTYCNNEEKANKLVSQLKKEYLDSRIYGIKLDITDMEACEKVVSEINGREGKIDVLVNNAGITEDGLFLMQNPNKWKRVIDVNLMGEYNLTVKVAYTMFKKHSGCIINISSVAGLIGVKGQTNYCAAKAAMIGMTKAMAKEFAGKNIRVNAIAPGYIETDMTKDLKGKDSLKASIPLNRFGTPEEVSETAVFLASDKASYINGTVIVVDGGLTS